MNSARLLLPSVSLLLVICGCAAKQPEELPAPGTGIHQVPGKLFVMPREEINTGKAVIIATEDFQKPFDLEVRYSDGTKVNIRCGRNPIDICAPFLPGETQAESQKYLPLDGRPWLDTELWAVTNPLVPLTTATPCYQACLDGKIYSSPNLTDLMDALEKLKGAQGEVAKSAAEQEASKFVVGDVDSSKMPVCDWRHRVGLDSVLPAPKGISEFRLVPASSHDPIHIEIDVPQGSAKFYTKVAPGADPKNPKNYDLDRIVFANSNGHSMTIKPLIDPPKCMSFTVCDHFEVSIDGHRGEIQTLDDKPLSESHIMKVTDALTHRASYSGCEGGRLFFDKDRATLEQELKVAAQNPEPAPKPGAPIFGHPETTDLGTLTIPAQFCDWSRRASLAEAMKSGTP